jgi:hypothetical protein
VRNLGTITLAELQTLGLRSREDLASLGWQEVCALWVEAFPKRANLNAFTAVIGAIDDVDWRHIDPLKKEEARRLVKQLRRTR